MKLYKYITKLFELAHDFDHQAPYFVALISARHHIAKIPVNPKDTRKTSTYAKIPAYGL